ncbi:uncharacterized protein SCHCODRAFT_02474067, partial [Schizophyllum commune H4-8]|uniref:uncharacterized protein n=1 Tax=Schizophyllum commune (strain H4-8 / FGSC 9210) TaxID=578458 RepID=UPI00215EAE8D
LPWLRKHNPTIDWTTLSIQFAPSLRAMIFQPTIRQERNRIEELPRDEPDAVGDTPDDPRVVLESVSENQLPRNLNEPLAWDQPMYAPQGKNSKQRKR